MPPQEVVHHHLLGDLCADACEPVARQPTPTSMCLAVYQPQRPGLPPQSVERLGLLRLHPGLRGEPEGGAPCWPGGTLPPARPRLARLSLQPVAPPARFPPSAPPRRLVPPASTHGRLFPERSHARGATRRAVCHRARSSPFFPVKATERTRRFSGVGRPSSPAMGSGWWSRPHEGRRARMGCCANSLYGFLLQRSCTRLKTAQPRWPQLTASHR
jgi:hypothetical protein